MTLSCEQVDGLLAPWVDGDLRPSDRAGVDAHLAICEPCASRAACERTAREVLQRRRAALLADKAPPALCERIAAARRAVHPHVRTGWRRIPISVAATLALAFSGLTLHLATGRSTTLLAAQLAADHVKCHFVDGDHGEVSPSEVQQRLAERYGFHARVPPSSPDQRLRLVGARRCLTGEGRNAHILYRVAGRPVSLYLVPDEARAPTTVNVLGRNAVVWSRDNGTYVLVADSGTADLGGVVRYMQRATR
jgi:anti-sigma factor RsiW